MGCIVCDWNSKKTTDKERFEELNIFVSKNLTGKINLDLLVDGYSWDGESQWCYTLLEYQNGSGSIKYQDEIARCLICGHYMKSYVCNKHVCDPIQCEKGNSHEWRLDTLQCKAFCKNCGQGSSDLFWRLIK